MVDRQTPTVRADDELERDAQRGDTTAAASVQPAAGTQPAATMAETQPARATPVRGDSEPVPTAANVESPPVAESGTEAAETALFAQADARALQEQWLSIQSRFVDEPRAAVEQAEQLVAQVMQQLTDGFARERKDLEARWAGNTDVSTEDLRLAIRRYRSFFNRLLAI